ncbi:MAG TPA: hypothetical protein VFR58_13995 [Flavisolibacter sp.]|nr:hypothetical protein [Flavisolibacter sp.]
MANEGLSVTDPLGKVVFLLQDMFASCLRNTKEDIFDDAATVIRKPALMIEQEGNPPSLYYFRSVGWHNTLLIEVGERNERWETKRCILNPSNEMLSDILRNGKQLL